MGISSFAAGFARSLGEGLKEDRLRAEATAEKRYQQRAVEIKTAQQQEKKIRTEFKQRVAEINEELNKSEGRSLPNPYNQAERIIDST